ncbi:MAG: glycosyltransferase, partial [Clostridiales bacterium]|nr:glycosyltransferase [Clostridiales bacterium]
MKKILYITTVSRTINAFLIPHIQMLRKQGHIVDCACSIDKSIDSVLISDGVKVYEIPFTRNPINPGNIKALKKLIRIQEENNYDIVHVHTPVASVYGRLLKLKFPKLNTIYTVHGFHFYRGAPIINWIIYYPIEKFMANFTDTMITMNLEDYEQSKKFNIKRTYKINGVGIDLSRYT